MFNKYLLIERIKWVVYNWLYEYSRSAFMTYDSSVNNEQYSVEVNIIRPSDKKSDYLSSSMQWDIAQGSCNQCEESIFISVFSQEHKLMPVGILKKVVSELVKQLQLADMMEVLKMTGQQKLLDDDEWDELVSTALLEITEKKLEVDKTF